MKMSIWNLLTLLLLIGTIGMVVIFAAIFILPNQILPVGMRPIVIPATPVIPTSTETPFQFPPTWTKVPPLPTETSTPLVSSTPSPSQTSFMLPSKTLTPSTSPSMTVTKTKTSSPATIIAIGTYRTPTRTPTKTRTKTPAKSATPCTAGVCTLKAVDDKVTVTPNPGFIVVNVRANDLPSDWALRITNLNNCPKPCSPDRNDFYRTFAGGKAKIVSKSEIAYFPPVGFMGTDTIGYKITTEGGSVDTANVIFTVTDGSVLPPTDITPHSFFTDSGMPVPFYVGSFNTTDPDSGSFTYRLVTGDGSTHNNYFSLTPSGDLYTAGMLTSSVLSIRVRSTDPDKFWVEQAIQIFVAMTPTPTKAAPVITSNGGGASDSISISENTTAVTTVTATDADSSTLTYSISGGADSTKFAIVASSGVLTFKTAPNFENPTDVGANNVYDVIVRVSDGTLTDTQALAVTITDVNEAPTITEGANVPVSMTWDGGTPFSLTLHATDVDSGTTFTWSISSPASNGTASVSGPGASNVITYTTTLVAPGSDSFTVEVSDGAATDSIVVNVTITGP